MSSYELYIEDELADIDSSFAPRLSRQLIVPQELQRKDAQMSFTVTLPATERNCRLFGFANVEEVRNKFNRLYKAELLANGVRIFSGKDGRFKLTKATRTEFQGNLYIPTRKAINEIFKDIKLTDNASYRIPFTAFAASVNSLNAAALASPQMVAFPFALYGLLPKDPKNADGTGYTGVALWDNTVRIGMSDIPPSINPLLMIRHIFESKGYKIEGTAFDDDRLRNLYQSYKNEADYVQPWNYGYQARIHVSGSWGNIKNMRSGASNSSTRERGGFKNGNVYTCDIFDSTNAQINKINDPGGNVNITKPIDSNGREWVNCQVYIPASGFYKVKLSGGCLIPNNSNWREVDSVSGFQYMGWRSGKNTGASPYIYNDFSTKRFELKLLRDNKQADFGTANGGLDGTYYRDNLPQNDTFNANNQPKYFPTIRNLGSSKYEQLIFIDKVQNPNSVLGFRFGLNDSNHPYYGNNNPYGQLHAAKPAFSYDTSENGDLPTRLAIQSPGYLYWGAQIPPDDDTGSSGSDDPDLGWSTSNRFKISLTGAPTNYTRRGYYNGGTGDSNRYADGSVNAVVWFDAGELLTIAVATEEGRYRNGNMSSTYGWTNQEIVFDLDIEPYQIAPEWLKVNYAGEGSAPMSWNDATTFDVNSIDLVKFLPADMSTSDYIENFCKAFNLILSQPSSDTFRLDIKQPAHSTGSVAIDLDNMTSVEDAENEPLNLPSLFKIGFTVDEEEEGYVRTGDDGGGSFDTGAVEENVLEQTSFFSFNWFKSITKTETSGNKTFSVPIISKAEPWNDYVDYARAMTTRYTNQALRFWYLDGTLNSIGATFSFNNASLTLLKVSNTLTGRNTLNYKNVTRSILTNYFSLVTNARAHYTTVKGYLRPEQYAKIDGTILAKFNSDRYLIAEVEAFDPSGEEETTLKLITKD